MKNHILTVVVVTLCLLVFPSRAMEVPVNTTIENTPIAFEDDDSSSSSVSDYKPGGRRSLIFQGLAPLSSIIDDYQKKCDKKQEQVKTTAHQDIYAPVDDDNDDCSTGSVVYHDYPSQSASALMQDIATSMCSPQNAQSQQPVNGDTSWLAYSTSSWRDFARPAEDTHEDLGKSTPSTICPSDQSDDDQEDTKIFYLYITNPAAAKFYKRIVTKHQFSLRAWKAEIAKEGKLSDIQKSFKKYKGVRKFCKRMKKALKKFNATQQLRPDEKGLIIELTTHGTGSVKKVTKYCQKSAFVDRVFTDEQALKAHIENYVRERAIAKAGFFMVENAEMDLLAGGLQATQIHDGDDEASNNSGS